MGVTLYQNTKKISLVLEIWQT